MVNQAAIDRFNSTYINALKDHCCQLSSAQPSKLSRIVSQVGALFALNFKPKYIPKLKVAQFEVFRQMGAECLGTSLRLLPTKPSINLAHLFLHSGGGGGNAKTTSSTTTMEPSAGYFAEERQQQQQAGTSTSSGRAPPPLSQHQYHRAHFE
jgi:hypothetical protein